MKQFLINIKTFVIAAFLCFVSLNSDAQRAPLERVAKLKIPTEAKPITREKIYASEKEAKSSVIAQSADRENLYEIGNIFIRITPLEGQVDRDGFKGYEYDFAQMRYHSSYYKFTTPHIRNATVACAQYELKNGIRGCIYFTAINLAFTKQLGIIIEYDIADRDKADKIYKHILKSIKMM